MQAAVGGGTGSSAACRWRRTRRASRRRRRSRSATPATIVSGWWRFSVRPGFVRRSSERRTIAGNDTTAGPGAALRPAHARSAPLWYPLPRRFGPGGLSMSIARVGRSLLLLLLILSSLVPAALALERPSAEALRRYRADGSFKERTERAREIGNHKVKPGLVASANYRLQMGQWRQGRLKQRPTPPPAWQGMPTTGTVRIFALLIAFSDYPFSNSQASIDSKLFGDGSGGAPYESLRNFYRRSSYNQLEIAGATLGWYTTAYPRSSVTQTTAGPREPDQGGPELLRRRGSRLLAVRQRRRRRHRLLRRDLDRPRQRLGQLLVGLPDGLQRRHVPARREAARRATRGSGRPDPPAGPSRPTSSSTRPATRWACPTTTTTTAPSGPTAAWAAST